MLPIKLTDNSQIKIKCHSALDAESTLSKNHETNKLLKTSRIINSVDSCFRRNDNKINSSEYASGKAGKIKTTSGIAGGRLLNRL